MRDLDILESWKEIADYLKKSERTCRRWEKEFGLSIHRMDGSPKARVFAYKNELDTWIQEMLHTVDDAEKRRVSLKGLNKSLSFTLLFFALCLIGVILWAIFFSRSDFSLSSIFIGGAPTIDSIAVLPFENLSGDPEQEYFTEGMHDALITELSKISALKVISRPSAMRFKNSDKSIPEIAKELGVKGLVAGSVLQEGERIRITIQLIESNTERNLWAEKYDKNYRDILSLHSEVARDIAQEIKINVTSGDNDRLLQEHQVNPESYKAYLLGRFHVRKLRGDGILKGIEYFQQAIEKDPDFALAHAWLSRAYALQAVMTPTEPMKAFPRAKAAAIKALEIDDALAEGHLALAWVLAAYDWNWKGAEVEYKRALELNQGLGETHRNYGWYLAWMGRFEEAIAEAKRALEIDPLSVYIRRTMGVVLYSAGLYDQAIEEHKRALDMEPFFEIVHADLGRVYVQKGMYSKAILELQEAVALSKNRTGVRAEYQGQLGYAYAVSGNRDEALNILEELIEKSKQMYVSPLCIAYVYVGLGMKEDAFEWMERAYEIHDGNIVLLNVWPMWDSVQA
ncbi:MAG: tetratricopeptide repeat protein, partial [Candidatus Aminicenantes bacterium]